MCFTVGLSDTFGGLSHVDHVWRHRLCRYQLFSLHISSLLYVIIIHASSDLDVTLTSRIADDKRFELCPCVEVVVPFQNVDFVYAFAIPIILVDFPPIRHI